MNKLKMSKWERKSKDSRWGIDSVSVGNDHEEEGDSEDEEDHKEPISIPVRICLWEFGQNDPKR